jgi:sortase A
VRSRLRATGITLCVVGALLLTFVAYQLWGTSLSEHAAQGRLRTELESQLHHEASTTAPPRSHGRGTRGDSSGNSDTVAAPTTAPVVGDPAEGQPVGFLSIPRIGMNSDVIVEGVGDSDLRQGPGHYPGTPLPGQPGNAAIAGHRTTYAAPAYNLNELQIGDPVVVKTIQGTFYYAVTQTEIVAPTDSSVLDNSLTSELTLTTCNPRYSSSQRLVVVAGLRHSELTSTVKRTSTASRTGTAHRPPASKPDLASADLGGGTGGSGVLGVLLWGLLTAGVAVLATVMWRRPRRPLPRWVTGVVGTPVVVLTLFIFFGHLSTLLPASF